jgi:predicted nucleotidyltransferase
MNPQTVRFLVNFCLQHLQQYGLLSIHLIGSRARGSYRPNSDHDFIAVIDNNAPSEVETGGTTWIQIYNFLDNARRQKGLDGIDLFVKHEASFIAASQNSTFSPNPAHDAATYGIQVYP